MHGGAARRLAHSVPIGPSPPQPTCPLVTDATYDPEPLSNIVNPPLFTAATTTTLHLSQFCLAVSQLAGSAFPLSYCTTLSACVFLSRYIARIEYLGVSKPGQIACVVTCAASHVSTTPAPDKFDFRPFSALQG